MFNSQDQYFMQRAMQMAHDAEAQGEVPVGAVLVSNNIIISEGHNRPIMDNDPTAHAEIVVLRQAAQRLKNYRLTQTTLYVTLEPCLMCLGAMIHARVHRLVFGAYDQKAGVVGSQTNLLQQSFLNHRIQHIGGLYAEACASLLSNFFKKKRNIGMAIDKYDGQIQ